MESSPFSLILVFSFGYVSYSFRQWQNATKNSFICYYIFLGIFTVHHYSNFKESKSNESNKIIEVSGSGPLTNRSGSGGHKNSWSKLTKKHIYQWWAKWRFSTFDLSSWGAWGAGLNMCHPETPASYESLPAPLATQIPTLYIHTSGGRGRGGLWC